MADQADAWHPVWDDVFKSRAWGKYPPEDLIRFIARNFYRAPDRAAVKVLEIGCGPGANLWYLAREGFTAHGIDGSAVALDQARARLAAEGLTAELVLGDMTVLDRFYPEAAFDAVIDVACLFSNRLADVRRALGQIDRVLKPGGKVYSQLIARETWGYGTGTPQEEEGTYSDVTEGPLVGLGNVHFFSLEETLELFGGYQDLQVEELWSTVNNRRHAIQHWIVTGRKP